MWDMHDTACLICPCPWWNGLSPNHLDLIEDWGMIMIWGLVPHIQPNQDLGHSPQPELQPLPTALTTSTSFTCPALPQNLPMPSHLCTAHCLKPVQDKNKTHLEHKEDCDPNPGSDTKSSNICSQNEGNQGEAEVKRELEDEREEVSKDNEDLGEHDHAPVYPSQANSTDV